MRMECLKTGVFALCVSAVFMVYGDERTLTVQNHSNQVYLTHCIHYEPEKWEPDSVNFTTVYRYNSSESDHFTLTLRNEEIASVSCEAYAIQQAVTVKNISDIHGDLNYDLIAGFPSGHVILGTHTLKAQITNVSNSKTYNVQLNPPVLPEGIAFGSADSSTPKVSGNCSDGDRGASLPAGKSCNLKLNLSVNKAGLDVNAGWRVGFGGVSSAPQRLNFHSIDTHQDIMVGKLEIYMDANTWTDGAGQSHDLHTIVGWSPEDTWHPSQMDNKQLLEAHIEFSKDGKTITIQ